MEGRHPLLFYFRKWLGDPKSKNTSRRKSFIATLWTGLASLIGIGLVAAIHYKVVSQYTLSFTIGSFGASAVLIYGEIRSPLAQPRNFVGGHVLSALIGT